jgi:uncharacterized membrane protein
VHHKKILLEKEKISQALISWYLVFFLVLISSIELDNIALCSYKGVMAYNIYSEILNQVHKIGYPILWGAFAFVLMIIGMKYKNPVYRIQSIVLLALIIIKVFIDVWSMGAGGRIATFIFLGLVLLIISFLYQKLKNIFTEENENSKEEEK